MKPPCPKCLSDEQVDRDGGPYWHVKDDTDEFVAKLEQALAEEVFIRSQGWSQWPTLDEIKQDAPGIVAAMGKATGWGGFDAMHVGLKRTLWALLDATAGKDEPMEDDT